MDTARRMGPDLAPIEIGRGLNHNHHVAAHYNDDDPAGCTSHDNHDDTCARCLIAAGLANDVTRAYYDDTITGAGRLR